MMAETCEFMSNHTNPSQESRSWLIALMCFSYQKWDLTTRVMASVQLIKMFKISYAVRICQTCSLMTKSAICKNNKCSLFLNCSAPPLVTNLLFGIDYMLDMNIYSIKLLKAWPTPPRILDTLPPNQQK